MVSFALTAAGHVFVAATLLAFVADRSPVPLSLDCRLTRTWSSDAKVAEIAAHRLHAYHPPAMIN